MVNPVQHVRTLFTSLSLRPPLLLAPADPPPVSGTSTRNALTTAFQGWRAWRPSDETRHGSARHAPGFRLDQHEPVVSQEPVQALTDTDPRDAFLQDTPYCDWRHPAIQRCVQSLMTPCASEGQNAQRFFYWVRDAIAFRVGEWNATASETLATRAGTCSNKANLFVALARAAGIPAGFYVLSVNGQEYLGPIVPPRLRKRLGVRSTHIHPAARLHGRWVRCDPTDDWTFAVNTVHLNPQSRPVAWDGEHDALLHLDPHHILAAHGPLPSIDDLLAKRPRIRPHIVRLGNLYIHFLRAHAATIQTHAALERAFQAWLWRHAPASAVVYALSSVWFDLHHWARGPGAR